MPQVPDSIARPDYADTGIPDGELESKPQSMGRSILRKARNYCSHAEQSKAQVHRTLLLWQKFSLPCLVLSKGFRKPPLEGMPRISEQGIYNMELRS